MAMRALANSYSYDCPGDWLTFARRVSTHVSTRALSALESTSWAQPHDELDADAVAEFLIAHLMSEDVIRAIAQCAHDKEARHCLAGIIWDALSRMFRANAADYWNEARDFVEPGYERGPDEAFGFIPMPPVTETAQQYLTDPLVPYDDLARIFNCELGVVADRARRTATTADLGSPLVRLDVVDVALYRAILAHPELLRTLNWRTFEQLLADILEHSGYEVELCRGTKDGGADLFAVKRATPVGPERFLIQAKQLVAQGWH